MTNLLIPRVPSVSQSAINAIALRNQKIAGDTAKEQLAGIKTSNLLATKQLNDYDTNKKSQQDILHLEQQAKAVSAALQAENPTQATEIFKLLGGDPKANLNFEGDDVSIDYPTHTFKGPRKVVAKMMEATGDNGIVAKDPRMWQWFASQGGSIIKKGEKGTDRYKVVGGRLVDISGDKPKVVVDNIKDAKQTNLLDKGLVKVGDSLVDVSDPKNPKPVFQEDDKSSEKEAQKEITAIEKHIYKIESGENLMDSLKGLPGIESLLKSQGIDATAVDAKQRILDYYENRLNELYKKIGKPRVKQSSATHVFIPGKGIVPK